MTFRNDMKMSGVMVMKNLKTMIPMLIGILLMISLLITAIQKELYQSVFTGNAFIDPLIGAAIGSIAAGNPINSYIIGGELLKSGVSMFAVTAFIVAWITVGVIQLPAESAMLGRRFALTRNGISLAFCVVISIVTVTTMGMVS